MKIAHPLFLLWLALLPLLAKLMRRGSILRELSAEQFGFSRSASSWRAWLGLAAAACVVLALARPFVESMPASKGAANSDVVFLLDVSRSMWTRDAEPNRLIRAKRAIAEIAAGRPADRLGLVVFSGTSSLECALTSDRAFFEAALKQASPESVSRGGTRIGSAIRFALANAFDDVTETERHLVLLSDGGDHQRDSATAAGEVVRRDIQWTVVGVGAGEPTLLPVSAEEETPVLYRGAPVQTKLESASLMQLAIIGKGEYRNVDEARVLKGRPPNGEPITSGSMGSVVCAALAFLLLALEGFSPLLRRKATAVCTAVLMFMNQPAQLDAATTATEWAASAYKAFGQNHFATAIHYYSIAAEKAPNRPQILYGLACSHYAVQHHDEAATYYKKAADAAYESELRASAYLGLGDSLYHKAIVASPKEEAELLLSALAAYKDALNAKSDLEDAKYNMGVVQRRLAALRDEKLKPAEAPPMLDPMTVIRNSKFSYPAQSNGRHGEPVDQDW